MLGILDRLKNGEVLLSDGGLGTMLFERGLDRGECPEKLNLDHPEIIEEVARLYLEAGSDIVHTNTFGGSAVKLAQYDLEDKTEQINVNAVKAVRKAIGDKACLSASIGPSGEILQPYGDADPEFVRAGFERQIRALVDEAIDMITVETMTDLSEARIAIEVARQFAPTIPIAATMTFDPTPRGFFTIMGITIQQAVEGLALAGADIVGSNCGNGIEGMIEIAREFHTRTQLPVLIQSNAGLPEIDGETLVYRETPKFMAEKCIELIDAGVNVIGGCCGTTPEHIAAFRRLIDNR